jgi:hypothetical protein
MPRRRIDIGQFVLKASLRYFEIVADLNFEVQF